MRYLVPLLWAVAAQAVLQVPAPPPKGAAEAAPAPHAAPAEPPDPAPAPPRERHALILCGHPGDAEHVKSFAETVRKLGDGLTKTVGIPPERQHVLFGADRPKEIDPGSESPRRQWMLRPEVIGRRPGAEDEERTGSHPRSVARPGATPRAAGTIAPCRNGCTRGRCSTSSAWRRALESPW